MRKRLEAVCKMPRRNCAAYAAEHSIPVNEETRLADDEPQLGERHRGNWDLFGEVRLPFLVPKQAELTR